MGFTVKIHPRILCASRHSRRWAHCALSSVVFHVLWLILTLAPTAECQPQVIWSSEVDVIDEFIERFNNQDSAMARAYANFRSRNPVDTRDFLIKSLFDFEGRGYSVDNVKSFIRQVNSPTKPVLLNFTDSEWYAELTCTMKYKGRSEKANVVLRYETSPLGYSRWMIVSAKAGFLNDIHDTISAEALPPNPTGLNPASHGNNFMSMYRAFSSPEKMTGSLAPPPLQQGLQKLVKAAQNGTVTLTQIDKVTYHFLQVGGWVFQVKDFATRKSNSGWLIANLQPANDEQKLIYKEKVLGLSRHGGTAN